MTLADPPVRRGFLGDRQIRWTVFLVLAVAGMSPVLVIIGCFLAVVPGLALMAAPNIVIYGAVAEVAVYAWRRTHSRAMVGLVVFAVACPLAGVPFALDSAADREVADATAGDFLHPLGPPPQSVAFVDPHGTICYLHCGQLEASGGRFIAFQSQQTDFTHGLGSGPSGSARLAPQVDEIVAMTSRPRLRYGPGGREQKLGLRLTEDGVRETDQWSVWRCAQSRCVEVQRLTEVRVDRLWPLLVVGFDADNYGMDMDRAWQRGRQIVNQVDMDAAIAAAEAGRPITPRQR